MTSLGTTRSIRVKAICVFRDGPRILVAPGRDDANATGYYRPLGGRVKFGETAADALRREMIEETGHRIERVMLLGVLENFFEEAGQPCHEILFVFDARFADESVYGLASVPFEEVGWAGPAEWVDPEMPLAGPLFPDGLKELLREAAPMANGRVGL